MADQAIYKVLSEIMAEIGPIAKGKQNQQQGYKFRGIDDVYNHLQPLLAKHCVTTVPEVLTVEREARQTSKGSNLYFTLLTVRYTFYACDGSSVSAVVAGEGMDSADKSASKAMSGAHKYALFQVFCIPTDSLEDADHTTPQPTVGAQKPKPKPKATDDIRDKVLKITNSYSTKLADIEAIPHVRNHVTKHIPDLEKELVGAGANDDQIEWAVTRFKKAGEKRVIEINDKLVAPEEKTVEEEF